MQSNMIFPDRHLGPVYSRGDVVNLNGFGIELNLNELAGVVGGTQQVDPKNDGAPIPQKHDIGNVIWLMRRQS